MVFFLKTLLIIAHPGHEIAAYHAVRLFKPHIYCLTDGSSGTGQARHWDCHHALRKQHLNGYSNIKEILKEEIVYQAILSQNYIFFRKKIVDPLREFITHISPEKIIFDAYEGYNPIHDLLSFLVNYICCKFSDKKEVCLMELKLTDNQYLSHRELPHQAKSKLLVMPDFHKNKYDYAQFLSSYIKEIPQDLEILKKMCNQEEIYLTLDPNDSIKTFFFEKSPFYEYHGKMRVREGKFSQVIEFEKHILPLICYFLETGK